MSDSDEQVSVVTISKSSVGKRSESGHRSDEFSVANDSFKRVWILCRKAQVSGCHYASIW